MTKLITVLVGLKFTASGVESEHEAEHLVHDVPDRLGKECETDDCRLRDEPECCVHLRSIDEVSEAGEGTHCVDLHNAEVKEGVTELPMSDLVAEHRYEFRDVHLLNERVEKDDALVLPKAVHIRIRVT